MRHCANRIMRIYSKPEDIRVFSMYKNRGLEKTRDIEWKGEGYNANDY